MSLVFATDFADLGKIFAAFANANGFAGSQAVVNVYKFTCSAVSTAPTAGATYTNNGITYTVLQTVAAAGTVLIASGNGAPTASGTLTKATGTGDATVTFSAFVGFGTWGASGPLVKAEQTMYNDILTRLQGTGLTGLIPSAQTLPALQQLTSTIGTLKQACVTDAASVVVTRVNNDVPQNQATSLQLALINWIQQMDTQSSSVQQATVSSAVVAGSNNTGNATVYASLYDPNGLLLENAFAEAIVVQCTIDQSSGATAGSETLSITCPGSVPTTAYNWPQGSSFAGTTVVVDPTQGNGGGNGNLLTGSTTATNVGIFKAWSGGSPVACVANVDSVNVLDGGASAYSGAAHCLKFAGNTGGTNLNTSVREWFANAGGPGGGSTQSLLPATVYNFYAQVKTDVIPAAGVVQISLINGAGTVINNNAGTANTITITLTAGGIDTTTYVSVTGSFQTPSNMPLNGVGIQFRVSTQISTGSNFFLDFVALVQPQSNGPLLPIGGGGSGASGYGGLYAGGPYLSVFRGSVDLVKYSSPNVGGGDTFTDTISNNYGSSSPTPLGFQVMFGQLFLTPQLGLILPSSGSPTIAASLIA